MVPRRRKRPRGVLVAGHAGIPTLSDHVRQPILRSMTENPIQILEVRAGEGDRPVTVTAAISAEASHATMTALSEQLDRRRSERISTADAALELRDHAALVERFAEPVDAEAAGIISLSDQELRSCVMQLTNYSDRVDGVHFQLSELRERLAVITQMVSVLWDANAAAAAASVPLAAH